MYVYHISSTPQRHADQHTCTVHGLTVVSHGRPYLTAERRNSLVTWARFPWHGVWNDYAITGFVACVLQGFVGCVELCVEHACRFVSVKELHQLETCFTNFRFFCIFRLGCLWHMQCSDTSQIHMNMPLPDGNIVYIPDEATHSPTNL